MNIYDKELQRLKIGISESLWACMQDNGCIIAGGAITSLFTNQEINDYDIYFPSKEAFTNVFKEVYKESNNYDLDFQDAIAGVVTSKALMLFTGEQEKIQFIVHKFYDSAEAIFEDFDFTVCMGALNMKDESWSFHPEFFKHNSQRYLHFNPGTCYPLVSAMRVDKYTRLKGYSISKPQFFKILCAVNAKKIESWDALKDEMSGMYGCKADEIFDTTKPFSMEVVMESLDAAVFKDTEPPNALNMDEVIITLKHAFTDEFLKEQAVKQQKWNDWREKYVNPLKDWL